MAFALERHQPSPSPSLEEIVGAADGARAAGMEYGR